MYFYMKKKIDQYEGFLGSVEKKFLRKYKLSINELLSDLERDGLLYHKFTKDQINRIFKLIRTSNIPLQLYNNFNKIITFDKEQTKKNVESLKAMGLRVDTIAEQYLAVLCHSYQVLSERLKLHLVTIIDFSKLDLENAHKKSLGMCIGKLKVKYPNNSFLQYLNTKIRNAVTHYSYFFEKGAIKLCDGYFGPTEEMTLKEFVEEARYLNVLTEGFFIIYMDKYYPEIPLILDR